MSDASIVLGRGICFVLLSPAHITLEIASHRDSWSIDIAMMVVSPKKTICYEGSWGSYNIDTSDSCLYTDSRSQSNRTLDPEVELD